METTAVSVDDKQTRSVGTQGLAFDEALVFGQIKEARGFRRFLLRGQKAVEAEWAMVCVTHNLLKLFRFCSLQAA